MKRNGFVVAALLAGVVGGLAIARVTQVGAGEEKGATKVELGNFSVSLAVKDIGVSRAFYEKLGFRVIGGKQEQKWLVMQNGTATVGIFQGMFEKNMLTFNPGWDRDKKVLPEFQDVRELQAELIKRGLTLTGKAEEGGTGPAYFTLEDPDGNPILVDQHVGKGGK